MPTLNRFKKIKINGVNRQFKIHFWYRFLSKEHKSWLFIGRPYKKNKVPFYYFQKQRRIIESDIKTNKSCLH